MAAKDVLLAHLVSKNQVYLNHNNVTLRVTDLDFTSPEAGEWEGGDNTRTVVTMRPGRRVQGSNVYYYTRNDLQEAFASIGVTDPVVSVDGATDLGKVLLALRDRYNLNLDPNEVTDVQMEDDQYSFGVVPTSLLWIGRLTLTVVNNLDLPLSVGFPNNVLDGLHAPF